MANSPQTPRVTLPPWKLKNGSCKSWKRPTFLWNTSIFFTLPPIIMEVKMGPSNSNVTFQIQAFYCGSMCAFSIGWTYAIQIWSTFQTSVFLFLTCLYRFGAFWLAYIIHIHEYSGDFVLWHLGHLGNWDNVWKLLTWKSTNEPTRWHWFNMVQQPDLPNHQNLKFCSK